MVMFEHMWGEDWVTRVSSGDVEPEVAVFIDGCNLIWAMPDGLQFLSKVLLKGSSLVHDEVSHLKSNVRVPALLCIFSLFVAGHNQVVMVYLVG